MTRKKFIKMCMSEGLSRNSAQYWADVVVNEGSSYREGYDKVHKLLNMQTAIIDIIPTIVETVNVYATALSEGVSAFSKAFSDAFKRVSEMVASN